MIIDLWWAFNTKERIISKVILLTTLSNVAFEIFRVTLPAALVTNCISSGLASTNLLMTSICSRVSWTESLNWELQPINADQNYLEKNNIVCLVRILSRKLFETNLVDYLSKAVINLSFQKAHYQSNLTYLPSKTSFPNSW